MDEQEVYRDWYDTLDDALEQIDEVVMPTKDLSGAMERLLPDEQRKKLLEADKQIEAVRNWLLNHIDEE